MERISGTLLIGTQMYSQLQQRQCIAEATAKEQQCLVDYFAQLRPKRWQEWERRYKNLSTAQYIFLIMQDDLHFDDETIAAALNVKRTSVRSMRSRIKRGEVILAKASGRAERRKRNEKAPGNIRKAAAEGAGLNPG